MLSARSCLLVAVPAFLALTSPAAAAPALRSAFVAPAMPSLPLTAVKGSLQNKPGANGVCGGPAVGTGKQRKQKEKIAQEKRVAAKALKVERDAAKAAARAEE
eukprot:Tamp_36783.p2 GENE.Tamp_36783~~Tamp_36783.p2  ORF type:complete len:103 (-),score=30.39 Tamp_36783:238-546(-)